MSKVRLTEKQVEALEQAKEGRGKDKVMNGIGGKWYRELEPLNDLTPSQMARALYIGYEVEPTYTKGDWVITEGGTVGEVYMNSDVRTTVHLDVHQERSDGMVTVARAVKTDDILRHATPEEIAEEKERRTDEKLNDILEGLNPKEKYRLFQILKGW